MNIATKRKYYLIIYHLANLLDNKFNIFGVKFGISAVIDLLPGFGDLIDAILSFYIIWIGIQFKIPLLKVIQMVINVIINLVLGSIPVLGDAVYILRKANLKNLEIIKQYVPTEIVEGKIV